MDLDCILQNGNVEEKAEWKQEEKHCVLEMLRHLGLDVFYIVGYMVYRSKGVIFFF